MKKMYSLILGPKLGLSFLYESDIDAESIKQLAINFIRIDISKQDLENLSLCQCEIINKDMKVIKIFDKEDEEFLEFKLNFEKLSSLK